jgi:hypothetical protein
MSFKCGKCHGSHETVAEGRACYGGAAIGQHVPLTTVHEVDGVQKDGQYELLQRLMEERDMPPLDPYDEIKDKISKSEASALISHLINEVKKPVAPKQVKEGGAAKLDVPAGYYATPSITGNNDFDFWHVQRPTEGKWAGYTFVKRVIGGHQDQDLPRDSKKKVKDDNRRLARATQTAALKAIVEFGVQKSHELFGTELKFCRECGTHLTDKLSRELGIGPDCRSRAA